MSSKFVTDKSEFLETGQRIIDNVIEETGVEL